MSGQQGGQPRTSRRRRRRRRGRGGGGGGGGQGGGGGGGGGGKLDTTPVKPVSGILAIAREGHGFLRNPKRDCQIQDTDPFVHQRLIQEHGLRQGQAIDGHLSNNMRNQAPMVATIDKVEGRDPAEMVELDDLTELTVIDPDQAIQLVGEDFQDVTLRVIDLVTPIGFGQRALIVAPPRTGKTVILQKLAQAIAHFSGANLRTLQIE